MNRSGFTLIELMVSIALALLLVLGINAVFKLSSDAVGTGQQLADATRQFRIAEKMFQSDMTNMANQSQQPALIIESYNQPAFRDKNDELAAETAPKGNQPPFDPTGSTGLDIMHMEMLDVRDPDGNSIYPLATWGSPTPQVLATMLPQVLNNRNHRADIFSFFVKNPQQFQRQSPNYQQGQMSGDTAEYAGTFKSTDAWVVYGHVLQPNNNVNAANLLNFDTKNPEQGGQTSFLGLGCTVDPYTTRIYSSQASTNQLENNPNNYYASNWVLGRSAFLLGDPATMDTYQRIYPGSAAAAPIPDPQTYAYDPLQNKTTLYKYAGTTDQQQALRPLSWGTQLNASSSSVSAQNGNVQIQASQADVGGATMETFRQTVLNAQFPPSLPGTYSYWWYQPLLTMGTSAFEVPTPNPQQPTVASPGSQVASFWPAWPTFSTSKGTDTPPGRYPWHAYRFMAQAWPDKMSAGSTGMNSGSPRTPGMQQQLGVQTPIFLRGCSQFIVEYAGDYVKQQYDIGIPNTDTTIPPGTILDLGEDGQVDFDVVSDGNTGFMKQIRWYGMTRSLDGGQSVEDTTTPMQTTGIPAFGAPPTKPNIVRPLYRYIQQWAKGNTTVGVGSEANIRFFPFEKPFVSATDSITGKPMYLGFPDQHSPVQGGTDPIDSYTCAWGPADIDLDLMPTNTPDPNMQAWLTALSAASGKFPSRSLLPWLIRVTIRLDDPTGRLPDGQTMQYIFKVPRPHT